MMPSDKQIELMDNTLSTLDIEEGISYPVTIKNEEDIAKCRIMDFAKLYDIGRLIENDQAFICNHKTLDFIENGGFKNHFKQLKDNETKEVVRVTTSDKNASYELFKNRIWVITFIASVLGNIYLILRTLEIL